LQTLWWVWYTMAKMSYFKAAIKNIEERFDIKIKNIKELECDSISIGALGYLIDDKVYLIAPARSGFKVKNLPTGKKIGELVEIKGNFQDLNYSEIKRLGIPAVILKKNQLWFNATPFTNFQKWLQFEYPIVPYFNWYDRMFWLDELSSFLLGLIHKISPENVEGYAVVNKSQLINYVILRHDVDESRDLTYLNFEVKNSIPATYALLLDKNLYYWLNALENKKNIEVAFHFMTNEINNFDYLKIILNKFFKTNFKIENLPIDWNKKPLWKQIKKFISKTNKIPFTIHRHCSFIKYPEFIDELEKISSMFPEIIGSSSFFRATVLYHNLKCANRSNNGYFHFEPDVGSPFWWVFKVYNPITQNIVNIYEQCHIMEPDIELLTKIFSKRIKGIKKNLFTIGLHPAHSNTKNFNENGQIETLKYLFKMKEKFNIKFVNYYNFLKNEIS